MIKIESSEVRVSGWILEINSKYFSTQKSSVKPELKALQDRLRDQLGR